MRSDDDGWLCGHCGPNSLRGMGSHGHCDQLSFELFARGESLIVDPGSYVYTADPEARNLFRSTAYHNTVRVDGQDQNRLLPDDLFRMADDTRAECLFWETGVDRDTFVGAHHGYERLASPVRHVRRIDLLKREGAVTILDALQGKGSRLVEVFLHLPPGAQAATENGGSLVVRIGSLEFRVIFSGDGELASTVGDGWVSVRYGQKIEAPVIRRHGQVALPCRMAMAISWGEAGSEDLLDRALRAGIGREG